MEVTRLYTNASGESAFEQVKIELERSGVEQLACLAAPASMLLSETEPGHRFDWHNAPKKQWVITLQGEIEVELRDGTRRRFGSGSIVLAEDLTGSGHATKVVSTEPWRCIYLPI